MKRLSVSAKPRYICLFLFLFLLMQLSACSDSKVDTTKQEPITYRSIEDLLFDPQFSDTPADGLILETTVDLPPRDGNNFVVGVLHNPDPDLNFYQFFGAQVVDDGYLLKNVTVKIGTKSPYWTSDEFIDGLYTIYFSTGGDLPTDSQLLSTVELENGKLMEIALAPVEDKTVHPS